MTSKYYLYVTTGRKHSVRLKIDERDVLINADGDLDCPLDTTLRKNGYSMYDLLSWETRQIKFILVENGVEKKLRTIQTNWSLE